MASVSFFTPDICGKENPGEDQEESHRNPGLSAPYEVMRGMKGGIKKIFSGEDSFCGPGLFGQGFICQSILVSCNRVLLERPEFSPCGSYSIVVAGSQ